MSGLRPCGSAAPPVRPSQAGVAYCDLPGSSTVGLNSGQAEAQVVVPDARLAPAAVRRPGEAGLAVPAPAAEDPARGSRNPRRIVPRRLLVIIGSVPVGTPLPDIPVHVVQAERVRLEPPHWRGVDVSVPRRNRPRPCRRCSRSAARPVPRGVGAGSGPRHDAATRARRARKRPGAAAPRLSPRHRAGGWNAESSPSRPLV